ncbi:MAG: fimbria/pilus outer membrane usher protein [Polyangiales bacterium]
MAHGLSARTDYELGRRDSRNCRFLAFLALFVSIMASRSTSVLAQTPTQSGAESATPSALPASAQTEPTERAILMLYVNDSFKGEIQVVLRAGDVLVPLIALREAGVLGTSYAQDEIEGTTYVSMASLAEELTYTFDERDLALRIDTGPVYSNSKIDLGQLQRPQGIDYRKDASGFLNYALRTVNFKSLDVFGEIGVSFLGHLLFSDMSVDERGSFLRGQSNFTMDFPKPMVRVVVWDSLTTAGSLGGSAFIGGVKVFRNFELDPYFVRFPSFGLSGAVGSPSKLDVYVDDRLVTSRDVSAGEFQLENIPVVRGAGATRAVVTDAFGRTQTIASPYYWSTGILAPGLQQYSYAVGARRRRVGTHSGDYGSPVFQGTHRMGFTDWLTGGFTLEGSNELINGGIGSTFRTPAGEIGIEGSAAYNDGHTGGAGALTYSYLSKVVSAGGSVRGQSQFYSNISLPWLANRSQIEGSAFVAVPIGSRASITAQYTGARYREGQVRHRAGLLGRVRIAAKSNMIATFSYQSLQGQRFFEGFLLFNHFFANRTTAAASFRQSGKDPTAGVQVQRPVALGQDYGYLVDLQAGATNRAFVQAEYQTQWGRYSASYEHFEGRNEVALNASGGFVVMGGSVLPTRAVSQSYGLIQVPGVKGVRGYLNNWEVGKTNRKGNLLVPDLLQYYGNPLSINDQDVPIAYELEEVRSLVAAPFRGGAKARFDVARITLVTGKVVLESGGKESIPSFGELTVRVNGESLVSPLGRNGEFYFDRAPMQGRYPATLEHEDGVCEFDLTFGSTEDASSMSDDETTEELPMIDLGTTRCVITPEPAGAVAEQPTAEGTSP